MHTHTHNLTSLIRANKIARKRKKKTSFIDDFTVISHTTFG